MLDCDNLELMNMGLTTIAGLLFFFGASVTLGYYLVFYIPYTADRAEYENDLYTYNQKMESCYASSGVVYVPCDDTDGTCDSGQVAGCMDIGKPTRPELPFAGYIRKIGEYTNLQFLKEAGL